jgi:hypothetical protein
MLKCIINNGIVSVLPGQLLRPARGPGIGYAPAKFLNRGAHSPLAKAKDEDDSTSKRVAWKGCGSEVGDGMPNSAAMRGNQEVKTIS